MVGIGICTDIGQEHSRTRAVDALNVVVLSIGIYNRDELDCPLHMHLEVPSESFRKQCPWRHGTVPVE